MRPFPQRLARPATPGELLKRPAIVTRTIKQTRVGDSDPAYLAMIRQLPCLRCGMEPCGEAAHKSGLFPGQNVVISKYMIFCE